MGDIRKTRRWQQLRARIRATTPAVCWICGQRINLGLAWPDPESWTLDHIVPIAEGGAGLDPANLRPAHAACNSKRRSTAAPRTVTSREW
jgi:5-methylcytosine-specific restriction endonuclease McrA